MQKDFKSYSLFLIPWFTVLQATVQYKTGIPFIQFVPIIIFLVLKKHNLKKLSVATIFLLFVILQSIQIISKYANFSILIVSFSIIIIYYFSVTLSEKELLIFERSLLLTIPLLLFGQLVNLFYDPEVFGLVYNSVYTNPELTSKVNVSERGVSFISSPQSLSAYFLICTYVSLNRNKYLFLIMAILGGILTGSKSYLMSSLILLAYINWKNLAYIGTAFAFSYLAIPKINNYIDRIWSGSLSFVTDASGYVTANIWYESIMLYMNNIKIFGYGLGTTSRYFISNVDSILIIGSTESYIITLIIELGIVSVLIVSIFVFKIFSCKSYALKALKVALLLNMMFTPAFGGSVISILGLPYLFKK